jgi:hypothetical protein
MSSYHVPAIGCAAEAALACRSADEIFSGMNQPLAQRGLIFSADIAKAVQNDYTVRMAYPIDFRRKVLEIKYRDGLSFEETALRFGVGKSSVSRWAKRLEPCLTRKKPATKFIPNV